MRINKIKLFNYGPFCGEHVIDFSKSVNNGSCQKNIILIGGKNGSGKTSIFTALQICFYGQSALGDKTTRIYYDNFLKKQVHKSRDTLFQNNTAAVEVDFDFTVSGINENYCVKRTWSIKGKNVSEDLIVRKNNHSLDDAEQGYWQEFVKNLIPQGLLQLFFFDGERISALTKEKDNTHIAESIKTLFGLDIINQLTADLRQYERKKLKTEESIKLEKDLCILEGQIANRNEKKEKCIEIKARLQTKVDSINNDIEKYEKELRSIGGIGFDRTSLNAMAKELDCDIKEKQNVLRSLFQKSLPLHYAKEYGDKALKRISSEEKIRKRVGFRNEFIEIWSEQKEKIKKLVKIGVKVDEIFDLILYEGMDGSNNLVHGNINDSIIADLKRQFNIDAKEEKKIAQNISLEIENKVKSLNEVNRKLMKIPDDGQISGYIEKINELLKSKGVTESKIAIEEDTTRRLNNEINSLLRDEEKIEQKIDDLASQDRRLSLVSKTNRVLQIFETRLIESRIKELEDNVLGSFNKLLRKGDILRSLKIDKNTFSVSLKDDLDSDMETSRLSEGEKQIYAVSMLSGIAKTSNRALPIIFDTPLGRLDSDHRDNIIEKYFPHASHQLIILSTDTEIDREYFNKLKPYLCHSYLFDYDKKTRQTFVKEGYFWK